MSDVFAASAKNQLNDSLAELRTAVEGASPEMLNRQPGGDGTNSIAVLVIHATTSTRWWLSLAVGAALPGRDRDSEFVATSPDAASLLAFIDSMNADCDRLLDGASDLDWSAVRQTGARPKAADGSEVPAAWALLHALAHLREHVGQMLLTRQLLDRTWVAKP